MIPTETERDYIINLYGMEPEELPDYEVKEAIQEHRDVNKN